MLSELIVEGVKGIQEIFQSQDTFNILELANATCNVLSLNHVDSMSNDG